MNRLKDKVCVITGGAGGMGGIASKLFAAEGAKIVIGDLKEAEGLKAVYEIEKTGGKAAFAKCDVSRSRNSSVVICCKGV